MDTCTGWSDFKIFRSAGHPVLRFYEKTITRTMALAAMDTFWIIKENSHQETSCNSGFNWYNNFFYNDYSFLILLIKYQVKGAYMTVDKISAKVQMGILKSADEIFETIVDPEKLCKFFITTGSGRMESGKTLTCTWDDFEAEHQIKVGKIEKDKTVSFEWNGSGVECVVVITLESKDKISTLVKITESDWPADYKGATQCMGQVEGWTHFLCCMKAYLEYGINLRVGSVIK